MPKVPETTKPKELRVVSFQVNEREYAVDIEKVVEIIYFKPVTPIPRSPSFIEGIIDLRGSVIPIVDVKKRLGLASDPDLHPDYILIVKIQDRRLGIMVDRVREVLQIETARIEPHHKIVRGRHSEFLTGVCRVAERLILLLDIETLLSTEEKDRLEEI
ncbi:MAG TPA: chemotaxis protein CheW [Nitrospiria bacterium]|jgi:purine-binding chemotaxis protein CheW|nr:chemotaxis protein CheW [Nitrospiria bacterium]